MKKTWIIALAAFAAAMNIHAELAAHWTLDEHSMTDGYTGSYADSSGNGRTLSQLTAQNPWGGTGLAGNALLAVKGSQYSQLGSSDSALTSLGSFSFSLFVDPYVSDGKKIIIGNNSTWGVEIQDQDTASELFNFWVRNTTGSATSAQAGDTALEGWDSSDGIGDVVNNTVAWHHVAGSYDAATGTLTFYVDGEKVSSIISAGGGDIQSSGNPFYVAYSCLGLYDDIQVYDEVLTDGQIEYLRSNPGSVIPEPASISLILVSATVLVGLRRLQN